MPYLVFQGDYILFAFLFVVSIIVGIVCPTNKRAEHLLKLAIAVPAVLIAMGFILVNGVQFDYSFFNTVVEGKFSSNPLDTFLKLDVGEQIWVFFISCIGAFLSSIISMMAGAIIGIVLTEGTKKLLHLFKIEVSDRFDVPTSLGCIAALYICIFAVGSFSHGSVVRYIAGTPTIDAKISSRLAEYCGWRDVVTVSGRFVSCGAELESGFARELQWGYGHGFGVHNTDEELVIQSSRVHLKDSGIALGDFVIELTWNEKGEALMLYTFDKDKTPPLALPQTMDAFAESTLHELRRLVEKLPDSRGSKVIEEMDAAWKHRQIPEVR